MFTRCKTTYDLDLWYLLFMLNELKYELIKHDPWLNLEFRSVVFSVFIMIDGIFNSCQEENA